MDRNLQLPVASWQVVKINDQLSSRVTAVRSSVHGLPTRRGCFENKHDCVYEQMLAMFPASCHEILARTPNVLPTEILSRSLARNSEKFQEFSADIKTATLFRPGASDNICITMIICTLGNVVCVSRALNPVHHFPTRPQTAIDRGNFSAVRKSSRNQTPGGF